MSAYTFRSVGTVDYDTSASNPLTPGAPSGKAVGDLLLLPAITRVASQTLTSLAPDFTQIYANNSASGFSFELWGRVADGSAADTPTVQWSGTTADAAAWIEAWQGNVYTDIATILAHSNDAGGGSSASVLPLPTLTITTADTLVWCVGMRYKTTVSNDCTLITAPGTLTKHLQHIQAGNAAMMFAAAYVQQTTATNYDGSDMTRDGTDETLSQGGFIVALKTAAVTTASGRMLLTGIG